MNAVSLLGRPRKASGGQGGLRPVLGRGDLVALSVSSVGPLFSIAATGGVMARAAGWWSLVALAAVATPFVISAFVFRLLNRHFPHAGASYHWAARVMGPKPARFQAWILVLAYFASIPPIIIPASTYTIALVAPGLSPPPWLVLSVGAGWIGFSLVPLLRGALPTARVTKAFLAVEVLSVLSLVGLALARWPSLAVAIHAGKPSPAGMVVVAVVAATALDGWEIDSYAAEESASPGRDPGLGGIVGAFVALGFYALLYPLMFAETPMSLLAGATNPMVAWASRLLPSAPDLVLVPVLASTAGGMWLTSYILSRALFAMGREGLLPQGLAKLNSRGAPAGATVVILAAAFAVTAVQLFYHSLGSFFALILSAAGFLLVSEFFLDSLVATVFLRRVHRSLPQGTRGGHHHHRVLLAASAAATAAFSALLVAFLGYGPSVLGGQIDVVIAVMVAGGAVFALWKRSGAESRAQPEALALSIRTDAASDRRAVLRGDGAA